MLTSSKFQETKLAILDVGCGRNKTAGAVGIDIDPNNEPDIIHDLNSYPYPIEACSYDKVVARHIIEHLDDPRKFLHEIHRILKPGGTALFETPHFSCRVAYSEPQHKLFYSYFMFTELIKGMNIKIIRQEITFYRMFRFFWVASLANKFPDTYERFWTYMFPAENVVFEFQKK